LALAVRAQPLHHARPSPEGFSPQFTVVDAAEFVAEPARDGTRSGTFIW
jgi:ATP-dependent phosphoenolpyruvate carboxykinase